MNRNNNFNSNSSLNNTYGSYNQAPNKPKMNDGGMNNNNNNMMMNNNNNNRNNKMGGGPGPMRGGHGRFTNRSAGPYGGGGGGKQKNFFKYFLYFTRIFQGRIEYTKSKTIKADLTMETTIISIIIEAEQEEDVDQGKRLRSTRKQ